MGAGTGKRNRILSNVLTELLINLIDKDFLQQSISVFQMKPYQITMDREMLGDSLAEMEVKYPILFQQPLKVLRQTWATVLQLNSLVLDNIQLVETSRDQHSKQPISHDLSKNRNILFSCVKQKIIDKILDCTSVQRNDLPEIILERISEKN